MGTATEFEPRLACRVLCYGNPKTSQAHVVAAATTRIEGTWKVYIAAIDKVVGVEDIHRVLDFGHPLSEEMAVLLFPCFTDRPYAR